MDSYNLVYKGKHILLVEDQLVTAMVESNAIKKAGFKLTHVPSGEAALKYMQSNNPVDLILMDIDMGDGISGIEAAQQILALCDVPIMFLSGHTEVKVIEKTETITSYGYVLKDGNVFVLLAAIRMAIRLHSARSLYKETYENSMNGIVIHKCITPLDSPTPEFNFHDVNPAYETHSGLKRSEVIGKSLTDVFGDTPEIRELQRQYQEILRSGTSTSKRLFFTPTQRWFELTIFPLTHEYLTVVMNNITEAVELSERMKKSLDQQKRIKNQLITSLCHLAESKDPYTAGHQEKTAQIAVLIAQHMGLTNEQIKTVKMAALVHDIGNINIPTQYLQKPGALTASEYGIIKDHPEFGYNILKNIEFEAPIAEIILQHHEREDGSGYPKGLKADEILLEAKILGVADVIESMSSPRHHRPKNPYEAVLKELSTHRSTKYNAAVVDVCLELFNNDSLKTLLYYINTVEDTRVIQAPQLP